MGELMHPIVVCARQLLIRVLNSWLIQIIAVVKDNSRMFIPAIHIAWDCKNTILYMNITACRQFLFLILWSSKTR